MNCEKVRLREDILLECPLCEEEIEYCDKCDDSPYDIKDDEWYCYSDGKKHYCNECWQEQLKKGDVK